MKQIEPYPEAILRLQTKTGFREKVESMMKEMNLDERTAFFRTSEIYCRYFGSLKYKNFHNYINVCCRDKQKKYLTDYNYF